MGVDSDWKPAYDVTLTVGGTTQLCINSTFSETVEEFDTTNQESDGDEEIGVGVTSRQLRFTIPVDNDNPIIPAKKSLQPCTWSDGLESYSGKCRILSRERRGGGKGGYFIDCSGKFTGAVTETTLGA